MRIPILLFFFLLIPSALAQSIQTIPGLDPASMEYEQYTGCINSCQNCEMQCKDSTILNLARTKVDSAICSSLSDDNLKNMCLDNVNNLLALTQKDSSYCDKLSNPDEIPGCKQSVITAKAWEANDASLCETESCKISIYMALAAQNNDPSFCDKIQEELTRLNCKNNIMFNAPVEEQANQLPLPGIDNTIIQQKLNAKIILIGIGAVIVLVVLIVAALLFLKKRRNNEQPEDLLKQRFIQLHTQQPIQKEIKK